MDAEDEDLADTSLESLSLEEAPRTQYTQDNEETHRESFHNLPTPEDTPVPATPTEKETLGLPEITISNPKPIPPANIAPRADQISADLDTSNIIPQEVKRLSKPTSRKKTYATQLSLAKQGSIHTYHNSFAAMSSKTLYLDIYSPSVTASFAIQKDPSKEQSSTGSTTRFHRDNLPPEPRNFKELANHPFSEQFKSAMRTEIDALNKKKTWTIVLIDDATQAKKIPIPTMWTYRYKFDEFGWLAKFKARLVARGDLQHTNIDTYAATLAAQLFRFLMALTASFDLETRQYDAVNAFANSTINEPTYCKVPQGWIGRTDILLLLQKALYGLKQSAALWYKNFSSTLIDLRLEPISGIDCIYTNQYMIVFFFVDDICVMYDKRHIQQVDTFEANLFATYEMTSLGEIEWFLDIRITRNRSTRQLWLCQDSYIDKLAAKFNISGANKPKSPLPVEDIVKFTGTATPQDILIYQQKVGSINFPAVITRPDIAYAASKLSEYLTNPSPRHLELVTRVIEYLMSTRTLFILFDGQITMSREILLVSSDASFADNICTRFSSQGYAFKLFGGLIDWKANKQKTVTLSSTEAELLAMSQTGKETLWWNRLFNLLEFDPGHQVAILTSENPRFSTKLRHVDIHAHWLRQEITNNTISIKWVPSAQILADGFTKSLPIQRQNDFVRLLGLVTKS